MPKTIFYAAVSLDGYLSGPDGDMTWAEKYLSPDQDYGWASLISSCGSVLMGRNTFEFEMDAGADRILPTYVYTSQPLRFDGASLPGVKFVSGDLNAVVQRIFSEHPNDIFVSGGAMLVKGLIEENLLVEMRLFVAPDVLGGGVQLFTDGKPVGFELEFSNRFPSGLVEMRYKRTSS